MSNDHQEPVGVVVFPGTAQERDDLNSAVRRHCICGMPTTSRGCAPHDLLLGDATMKRLVFYRRWRRSLTRAEWLEEPFWRAA